MAAAALAVAADQGKCISFAYRPSETFTSSTTLVHSDPTEASADAAAAAGVVPGLQKLHEHEVRPAPFSTGALGASLARLALQAEARHRGLRLQHNG